MTSMQKLKKSCSYMTLKATNIMR